MTDIALVTNSDGRYDISFENGDFKLTDTLLTAIILSIFCEQRDESIDNPQSQGGWAGNQLQEIQGYQQGSLLWTLYQSNMAEDQESEVVNILEDALQWLIDDGYCTDIQVTVSIDKGIVSGNILVIENSANQVTRTFRLENDVISEI
jgi:phage gp46-like protein